MKQAVRAIVIKGDTAAEDSEAALLVMHRNKFGKEYYTLIGGGVELHENLKQALMREVAEETGVHITNPRLVFIEDADRLYGRQYVYLCEYVAGEPVLSSDSGEAKINQLGQNLYQPMWLPLTQLAKAEFLSVGLKKRILEAVTNGKWPELPEEFHHTQTKL